MYVYTCIMCRYIYIYIYVYSSGDFLTMGEVLYLQDLWPHFSDYVQYEHRQDTVLERFQRNRFYFIFFEYPRSRKKSLNESRS